MAGPIDEVRAFFGEWGSADSMIASIRRRFTAETVWENVGLSRTTGAEEAVGFMRVFFDRSRAVSGRVETRHIAATGNVVLTERIDFFLDDAGEQVLAIPLMGVLEMDGPRILAWRDYFDTRSFTG